MEIFKDCTQAEFEEYRELLSKFDIPSGHITEVKPMKNGRINTTRRITIMTENGLRRMTLQQINIEVFKKPVELMDNVAKVTEHALCKGNVALHVNKVKNPTVSQYLYFDEKTNAYWRLYDYIDAEVLNSVKEAHDMRKLGTAIKSFMTMYDDFDITKIVETIPNFHNTAKRYERFCQIKNKDENGRVEGCREWVDFILERGHKAGKIVDALEMGVIPYRVSHNDTKLNNVLFDKSSHVAMCWIDLDTVMPGTVLFDFGDAARFGCNMEAEDAKTTENVSFNLEYFSGLVYGFLSKNKIITDEEIDLLYDAVWTITYEQAIRFLDDHIDGDKYFGVEYAGQNLERALVQIALLKDIEAKEEEMKNIINIALYE